MSRTVAAAPPAEWAPYWDRLEERVIFPVEAADYVGRLTAVLGLDPAARVLDFGCGFGHVAARLAPRVRELAAWDASEPMRRRTRQRLGGHANARVLDGIASPGGGFDLVLVNSVVQYMSRAELHGWLERWRPMLAPGGRIVLSDLLTGEVNPLRELVELLALSARGGVLSRILWQGVLELRHYARARRARPLTQIDLDDLRGRANALGLGVTVLPRNLAYRTARTTVVLRAP